MAIGPTEDQQKVLKALGLDPERYANAPRESITAELVGIMGRKREKQPPNLTQGQRTALRSAGYKPDGLTYQGARTILARLTAERKRSNSRARQSNARAQGLRNLQNRETSIKSNGFAVGMRVIYDSKPRRITMITENRYLRLEGLGRLVSPLSVGAAEEVALVP